MRDVGIELRDGSIKLKKRADVTEVPSLKEGRIYEKIEPCSFEKKESCSCFFVQPDLLERIANCSQDLVHSHLTAISTEGKEVTIKKVEKYIAHANETLKLMQELQTHRDNSITAQTPRNANEQPIFSFAETYNPDKVVKLYDAKRSTTLPGWYLTAQAIQSSTDPSFKRLWDVGRDTARFYFEKLGRASHDNRGSTEYITDNYGVKFDNAYWDGDRMVFGRGDGKLFAPFSIDNNVYIHENGHAVVQETVNLRYQGQSGALNESYADVFGKSIEKLLYGGNDWLVGDKVLIGPGALRNMEFPGTAYNEKDQPLLGNDPQPDHMAKYVKTDSDNGGVHINSGIPNRFYVLVAQEIGIKKALKIWYKVLEAKLISYNATFETFTKAIVKVAEDIDGDKNGMRVAAVKKAAHTVGLMP